MTVIIYCYGDGHPAFLGLDNMTDADRQAILLKLQTSSSRPVQMPSSH